MKNSTEAHFRQRLIKRAESHGVTEAAISYQLTIAHTYEPASLTIVVWRNVFSISISTK